MSDQQLALQGLAKELGARLPGCAVEYEPMDSGGAWLSISGKAQVLQVQWSPLQRSFGLSLNPHDHDDAAFAPHDESFTSFEDARARVLELVARPGVLNAHEGERRTA